MDTLLLAIFATIFIATLLNIIFKKQNISHILGYIFTGTIISYLFDFNTLKIDSLDLIAEFGRIMAQEWTSIGLRAMYGYMADVATDHGIDVVIRIHHPCLRPISTDIIQEATLAVALGTGCGNNLRIVLVPVALGLGLRVGVG